MTIATIAVGVDASEDARRAFGWAATLAGDLHAEVVVVHAVGLLEHGSHQTSAWLETFDAPGVRVRRVVRDGPPAATLLAVAGEERADLLVVGCRGVGGATSLLLGSTSTQVLAQSSVPVVVVPR